MAAPIGYFLRIQFRELARGQRILSFHRATRQQATSGNRLVGSRL